MSACDKIVGGKVLRVAHSHAYNSLYEAHCTCNHSVVFFSYNKSVNIIFCHDLAAKRERQTLSTACPSPNRAPRRCRASDASRRDVRSCVVARSSAVAACMHCKNGCKTWDALLKPYPLHPKINAHLTL